MRWAAIFLRQFCRTLDRCRAQAQGRVNFHFASELLCLIFERFPKTKPNFVRQPRRPMLHVRMQMWGQMMRTRGESDFFVMISHDAL